MLDLPNRSSFNLILSQFYQYSCKANQSVISRMSHSYFSSEQLSSVQVLQSIRIYYMSLSPLLNSIFASENSNDFLHLKGYSIIFCSEILWESKVWLCQEVKSDFGTGSLSS